MAIAFVQSTTANATTTPAVTTAFAAATTAGNTIVVTISDDSGGLTAVTGVTDSKGNTYQRILIQDGVSTLQAWWCPAITGAGTTHTVSIAWNTAATGRVTAAAQEFGGFAAAPVVDRTIVNAATSTAATSTATAATTAANELVVGALSRAGTASAMSLGSGYTNLGTVNVANAGVAMESKVVAATGAQTATFTIAASRDYVAACITFKAGNTTVNGTAAATLGGLAGTATGTIVAVPTAHTSETPTSADVANGTAITVGARFTVANTVTVNAIVWWTPTTNTGTYTGQLWQTVVSDNIPGAGTGTLLASATAAASTVAPGWSRIPITPQTCTPGVVYTAAVHSTSSRYAATGGAFLSAGISNGGVTLVQSGSDPVGSGTIRNGVFLEGASPGYPTQNFNGTDYFVDVRLAVGSTVNGTATAALGGVAASAAGTRRVPGAATATLGALAATAAGKRTTAGTATGSLSGLAATGVGRRSTVGSAAAPLGLATATATGTRTVTGTGLALLGGIAATAVGQSAGINNGTAVAPLGPLNAVATGLRRVNATAAAPLGALAAAAVGRRTVKGAATAPLGRVASSTTGQRTVRAAGTAPLGQLAGHADGPVAVQLVTTGRGVAGARVGRGRGAGITARNQTRAQAARNQPGHR